MFQSWIYLRRQNKKKIKKGRLKDFFFKIKHFFFVKKKLLGIYKKEEQKEEKRDETIW